MSIEQQIQEKVAALPPDKRLEVLDFADYLQHKVSTQMKRPRKSLRGALARPGLDITEEDIAEARREMWTKGVVLA